MSESAVILEVQPVEAEPPREYWLAGWLRSRKLMWLILVALYVIAQPPEKGLGVDLCTMHRTTGLPCPGCGMTRSGANIVRGNFVRAFQYHPLGFVLIPTLFFLTAMSLMPAPIRDLVAQRFERRKKIFRAIELVVLIAFVAFGVIRIILVAAHVIEFPFGGPPPA